MYIFMLCMVILMPVAMIIFGRCWQKSPPRKINDLYGYRTAMSMKSQETWDFAHRYCGRIWLWSGAGILLLSVIAMVIFRGDFYTAGGWIVSLQALVMLLTIPPTEWALRRRFDRYGWPKEQLDVDKRKE